MSIILRNPEDGADIKNYNVQGHTYTILKGGVASLHPSVAEYLLLVYPFLKKVEDPKEIAKLEKEIVKSKEKEEAESELAAEEAAEAAEKAAKDKEKEEKEVAKLAEKEAKKATKEAAKAKKVEEK